MVSFYSCRFDSVHNTTHFCAPVASVSPENTSISGKKKKHLHEYLDAAPASILFSSSVTALTSEDFSHEMLEAARDSSAIRE